MGARLRGAGGASGALAAKLMLRISQIAQSALLAEAQDA
jgi:hypothetical protein